MKQSATIAAILGNTVKVKAPVAGLQGKCLVYRATPTVQGYVYLTHNGRQEGAHRIVWKLVNGTVPTGKEIMHVCTVRACVNPFHLRAATPSEIMSYRSVTGNYVPPRKGYTKLTEDNVRDIWARLQAGERPKDIAELFGCTAANISMIKHGKQWRQVTGL